MVDGITIGDPMFESSITHAIYGDYHSRKGDRLLAQAERLREELGGISLDAKTKGLKEMLFQDTLKELAKCGSFYAERASAMTIRKIDIPWGTSSLPIAATPRGQELLAGSPKLLKH